ncbi:hypothetical protein ACLB2K_055014 [Fragaria x ananassa]
MCISFVRHSLDEYDGNKQKKDKLWETIFSDYMQNWKLAPGEKPPNVERTRIRLASHYNKFKLFLQKWGESLATARQKIASGTSLMDEERQAQSLYFKEKKKRFAHFECWEVVKDHPSFAPVLPTTPSSYVSTYDATPSATESSPTINLDDDQVNETPQSNMGVSSSPPRPMGTKAAKEARRLKKHGKTPIEQQVEYIDPQLIRTPTFVEPRSSFVGEVALANQWRLLFGAKIDRGCRDPS